MKQFATLAATTVAALAICAAPQTANAQSVTFTSGTNTVSTTYTNVTTTNSAITNFVTGANVSYAGGYNTSTLNISGGYVDTASSNNNSTTNISGGSMYDTDGSDSSTVNITGGSMTYARGFDTSTVNINGGSVTYAIGYNASTLNISGGTLANGVTLYDTTTKMNFVGTGLSFVYQSYGNSNPLGYYADFFKVTGTIGGTAKTYNLYIRNETAGGGAATPNGTPRQFTFNGAAVAVPEAGTFALLLPALGVVCGAALTKLRFVTVRRRRSA